MVLPVGFVRVMAFGCLLQPSFTCREVASGQRRGEGRCPSAGGTLPVVGGTLVIRFHEDDQGCLLLVGEL